MRHAARDERVVVRTQSEHFVSPPELELPIQNVKSFFVGVYAAVYVSLRLQAADTCAHVDGSEAAVHQGGALVAAGVFRITLWHFKTALFELGDMKQQCFLPGWCRALCASRILREQGYTTSA